MRMPSVVRNSNCKLRVRGPGLGCGCSKSRTAMLPQHAAGAPDGEVCPPRARADTTVLTAGTLTVAFASGCSPPHLARSRARPIIGGRFDRPTWATQGSIPRCGCCSLTSY